MRFHIKNHTEIKLKMYIIDNQVVSASMFNTHGFRGRDKMIALLKMTFWHSFSYMELFYYCFCKFDFNVFLDNFQIQNYCIILSSSTEINCRGANAVHRMTSLDGNVFSNTLPLLHKEKVIQRGICQCLIPFAWFFLHA